MLRDYKRTTRADSRIPARAKALMVLIATVTLIAIWLVPVGEKDAPPKLPEMASPPATEQPVPLPRPAAVEDAGKTTQHEGDRARAIVAKLRANGAEPDPGEVFAYAEQLLSEGQVGDAYLLYRLAARQGHAQAALVLGTQADPNFYTPESSVLPGPDVQQAYKWYRAAAAGSEEAVQRLQRLREYVKQAAADGDAAAQRLMLQWR
jgi:hypothetical protein